jgi:6-pyruvoyltetrahydropterin/6-carboxytetrahydropterin synthase
MFELSIEREFCAAHSLIIKGEREPTHGHNWKLQVVVAGKTLDGDGLLCDFHLVERRVDEVIRPFCYKDLNATPPFDRLNPTAEHVVMHLAQEVARRLPKQVTLLHATVSEAPGCKATYRMDRRK